MVLSQSLKLKKFLQLRAQIGHEQKILHKTMNSYAITHYQNISILRSFDLIWSWNRINNLFTKLYFNKQKFLILSTNPHLNSNWFNYFLENYMQKMINDKNNLFLGYISHDWYGGIISNWLQLRSMALSLFKKLENNILISKKKVSLLKKAIQRISIGSLNIYPDYLISFTANSSLLHESKVQKIISIGLVDTDKNVLSPSLSVFGNDDSVLLLYFFFKTLKQNYYQSVREEQEMFYLLMFDKLKQLLI